MRVSEFINTVVDSIYFIIRAYDNKRFFYFKIFAWMMMMMILPSHISGFLLLVIISHGFSSSTREVIFPLTIRT